VNEAFDRLYPCHRKTPDKELKLLNNLNEEASSKGKIQSVRVRVRVRVKLLNGLNEEAISEGKTLTLTLTVTVTLSLNPSPNSDFNQRKIAETV
jgi:hypothetical protein